MTPNELVTGIQEEVLERVYQGYLRAFLESGADSDAIQLFRGLDNEEKRTAFLAAIRQTQIDTISMMLAVLDGSLRFANQSEDLLLFSSSNLERPLSGDLTDEFLQRNYAWKR